MAVLLPFTMPMWILFAFGYTEYYTLVVCVWLASLAWLFERPFSERSPIAVGALVGLLPVVYSGFALLSAIVFGIYTAWRPNAALKALGAATVVLFTTIAVCHPAGVTAFFKGLFGEMNFGELHTMFPRYVGQAAGPASIFFSVRYAFAGSHLRDLAYMTAWSGGWLLVPLAVMTATLAARGLATREVRLEAVRDPRLWAGLALAAAQLHYMFFMIPKMGPTRDIDLFFTTYVVLAFTTGWLLDRIGTPRWNFAILALLIGSSLVTSVFLAWTTLDRRA
jgi:hypothetical protein